MSDDDETVPLMTAWDVYEAVRAGEPMQILTDGPILTEGKVWRDIDRAEAKGKGWLANMTNSDLLPARVKPAVPVKVPMHECGGRTAPGHSTPIQILEWDEGRWTAVDEDGTQWPIPADGLVEVLPVDGDS